MAFNWKALAERLDPRRLNWSWAKPARDWAVANRTIVLSTSVALLAGLWGGAVLGRVSTGAPMRRAQACRKWTAWRSCVCARR
jgi:hypothetical protein